MPQKRSKGITRNKIQLLHENKQSRRKKVSRQKTQNRYRFAKQNLPSLNQYYTSTLSPQSTLKTPLGIQLQKMPTMATLPPQWVQKYQECLGVIKSIDQIKKQILTEQSRRLSLVKALQQKQSQRKIYDLTMLATKKIKLCQKIVQQIQKQGALESQSDQKTRKNACVSLAVQIQEKTKQLRKQQKAFVQQRQNIQKSTKVSFLQLAASKACDLDQQDDIVDQEQLQLELRAGQQRNQQILKIVQSIHELNQLYKQFSNLVIVQGSLLDRIDQNLQQSVVNVKKAQQTLTKVDDKQKNSKCACITIAIMLSIVVILGIILIVKQSKH